ncbi:epoxyqueuosine reductase [Sporohalobacter salinus]|uniref:epoxyqueuosine reductase n=1 Tax=Sporohalobacter salinus TaxID=1494606 RepID=UPI001EF7C717|nr:epoxyqueuosine reductase [Sporohalobacter salinus]MBM7624545.1 epoxyqueuosine reductase [Sporohalobacter salinus]
MKLNLANEIVLIILGGIRINKIDELQFSSLILKKAKEFGADLVGIANVDELKECPSYIVAPKISEGEIGQRDGDLKPGEVDWPKNGKSVIVIAVSHPENKPKLDWWRGKTPPLGNKKLVEIIEQIIEWINNNYGEIETYHMPYHVEKGGIFLKDAAVMAGLGCIGRNNLLISPEYGPRVRLRAMIIDQNLPSTDPIKYDPCSNCEIDCLSECPQNAFEEIIYNEGKMGTKILPGKIGNYSRFRCNNQMEKDIEAAEKRNTTASYKSNNKAVKLLKYCRICEFSCPIGK